MSGFPVWLVERRSYDELLSMVRVALGDEVFAARWAAGRAVTGEEAVAIALQDYCPF